MVRAEACGASGCRFESGRPPPHRHETTRLRKLKDTKNTKVEHEKNTKGKAN